MSWFSDADFWSRFYDFMFPEESFHVAGEQVKDIIKLTGIDSGAVLDLCCGPGRHSVPFQKMGFDVTGVDLQEGLLDRAKEYASRENVNVRFIREDMRRFRRAESFDFALNMFSSFGYFEDPSEDLLVLENVYSSCVESRSSQPNSEWSLSSKGLLQAEQLAPLLGSLVPYQKNRCFLGKDLFKDSLQVI